MGGGGEIATGFSWHCTLAGEGQRKGNDRLVQITSTKALKNLCKGAFRSVFCFFFAFRGLGLEFLLCFYLVLIV